MTDRIVNRRFPETPCYTTLSRNVPVDDAWRPNADGVLVPDEPPEHRDHEYDPAGFAVLQDMQARHFWYQGRHRFILHVLKRWLPPASGESRRGIDLGGGCGGWIGYLKKHAPGQLDELALADSSLRALTLAAEVVGADVKRFQVDLLNLPWYERWDVAFMLDVLEHIPQDLECLKQVHRALHPGGVLFVTTPALRCFWTYNDDLAHHVRRYSRRDFRELAIKSGFELIAARYFMFFLSPVLLLSRLKGPDWKSMTERQIREHLRRTHAVPAWPVNQACRLIFSLETPVGAWLPFPWGTSILAVLRKCQES